MSKAEEITSKVYKEEYTLESKWPVCGCESYLRRGTKCKKAMKMKASLLNSKHIEPQHVMSVPIFFYGSLCGVYEILVVNEIPNMLVRTRHNKKEALVSGKG